MVGEPLLAVPYLPPSAALGGNVAPPREIIIPSCIDVGLTGDRRGTFGDRTGSTSGGLVVVRTHTAATRRSPPLNALRTATDAEGGGAHRTEAEKVGKATLSRLAVRAADKRELAALSSRDARGDAFGRTRVRDRGGMNVKAKARSF